jgi:hypothetical protein
MLLVHTPALLQEYFAALLGGLKAGDKVALEQVGEIFNYVKGRGISLSMNQQILQANAAAGEQAPVIGYDTLVRQIAESRAGRALPAPSTAVDIRPADTTVTVTAEA